MNDFVIYLGWFIVGIVLFTAVVLFLAFWLAYCKHTALWLMSKAYRKLIHGMSDENFNHFIRRLQWIREESKK